MHNGMVRSEESFGLLEVFTSIRFFIHTHNCCILWSRQRSTSFKSFSLIIFSIFISEQSIIIFPIVSSHNLSQSLSNHSESWTPLVHRGSQVQHFIRPGSALLLLWRLSWSNYTVLVGNSLGSARRVWWALFSLRARNCVWAPLTRRSLWKPMPPHHPIFGHILLTAKIIRKLPKDAHGHYIADQIRRQFPYLDSFFYLDNWPFSPPVLVVISPHAMSQFTQENVTLQKHKLMRQFLRPLTGKHDLVSMEGQLWKKWRTIFNPGFSATHLATMVPEIMKDVLVFRDILRQRAEQGNIFSLEETTLNVTLDVIGRVTLLVLESKQIDWRIADMT